MMAITVASPLPDLVVAPGGTVAPIDTAAQFSVSGVTVQGTVVKMATQRGTGASVDSVFVELFDQAVAGRSAAPVSTANFLSYVNKGSYTSTFFHRASDFAGEVGPATFLQGGGYTNVAGSALGTVATVAPINLEWAADRPNARGTIAYARTSDPNSATSGFFFNVAANPGFDATGNQYATFGRVVGGGQTILDAYATLTRVNGGGPFATVPVSSTVGLSDANIRDRLVMLLSANVVGSPTTAVGISVTSSDPTVASVVVDAAGKLLLGPTQKRGTTIITVTGTDLSGAAVQDAFTVTVGIPGIAVADGVTALASNQAQAVSLGAAAVNAVAPSKTFTVSNPGDAPLAISAVKLPAGVTIVQALPTSIPAGGSANLVVALDTAAMKAVSGSIAIASSASGTAFSIPVTGTVFAKPLAPTGLAAAWGNGLKVIVSWNPAVDNGSPVFASAVYAIKIGTVNWIKVADVQGRATSTEVFGLDITAAYAFKVASKNAAGFSRLSLNSKFLMAPIPPTAIAATATAPGTATLAWQHATQPWDTATNARQPLTGYVVFHREVGTTAWTRSGDIPVVTSTNVTGLVVGKTYQFAVRAKSESGGSLLSKVSNSIKV
jgi:cyclophilin family peptidyl-prolyl cis-trans isomerase